MTWLPTDLAPLLARLSGPDPRTRETAAEHLADLPRAGLLGQEQAEHAIGRLADVAVAEHPGADAAAARYAIGEVCDGVYRNADQRVGIVAPHLVGFLDLLRAAVHDHVRTGALPDL
ncbi:hypothetical protein [Catellatospora sp. NPDC049133]|uniref:hypothetical protein n=1 Tax=Catellatospora sp. NPDC049133 TaxID=3155499 RepID=UPI0033E1B520